MAVIPLNAMNIDKMGVRQLRPKLKQVCADRKRLKDKIIAMKKTIDSYKHTNKAMRERIKYLGNAIVVAPGSAVQKPELENELDR